MTRRRDLNHSMPAARYTSLGDAIFEFLDAENNRVLTASALAIKAGGSAIVRSTKAFLCKVAGELVNKAAGDMSALAGTLATAKSAAWAFYIDASGTITTSAKTADSANAAAALALVPATPTGLVMFGIVVIDNATGSNFVGGTTALDTGSLTVTYYDLTGGRQWRRSSLDIENRWPAV